MKRTVVRQKTKLAIGMALPSARRYFTIGAILL
jgi:hypothetical protein